MFPWKKENEVKRQGLTAGCRRGVSPLSGHSLEQGHHVVTQDLMVVASFQNAEAATPASPGRFANHVPDVPVILRAEGPAPVLFMIVKSQQHWIGIP